MCGALAGKPLKRPGFSHSSENTLKKELVTKIILDKRRKNEPIQTETGDLPNSFKVTEVWHVCFPLSRKAVMQFKLLVGNISLKV